MTKKHILFMDTFFKFLILNFLIVSHVYSTTFITIPFKKQINEINGVIRGVYKSKSYKRMEEGTVLTEASFSIIESSGIAPSQIINKNDFKVNYLGGKFQGMVYHTIGAPKFKKNEEVILFLKKVGGLFYIYNLSQGKFHLVKEGKKLFLDSPFLRKQKNGNRIGLADFNFLLKKRFGSPLTSFNPDTYVYKRKSFSSEKITTTSAGRQPASLKDKPSEEGGKMGVYWLLLIFSLLGLFSLKSFGRD